MTLDEKASLIDGPVGRQLVSLALPMLGGIFAMVAFHLADTYFVSRLPESTEALAAMGFIAPVVMFAHSIAMGMGIATASVVSRAIGAGDRTQVRRLTTHALLLALVIVAAFSTVGLLTIDPLFRLLGAGENILPRIREYMSVWYFGMIFVVIPMTGNNALRARGDTKTPSLIMITAAGLNCVLDPLLIFGLAGFPRMGLRGAAVATVVARALTLPVSLAILHFRDRMIDFSPPKLRELIDSWRRLLYVGLPAAATRVMMPLSIGVITWMISRYGDPAVAAIGIAARIGAFALLPVFALGSVLVPFVGQNWGAGAVGRVQLAQKYSDLFCILWGVFCLIAFAFLAGPLATVFSDRQPVINTIIRYLWIVSIGLGLQGVFMVATSSFNAINRPLISASLSAIRVFALVIPLAWLGSQWYGIEGIFGGMAAANILAGMLGLFTLRRAFETRRPKAA